MAALLGRKGFRMGGLDEELISGVNDMPMNSTQRTLRRKYGAKEGDKKYFANDSKPKPRAKKKAKKK